MRVASRGLAHKVFAAHDAVPLAAEGVGVDGADFGKLERCQGHLPLLGVMLCGANLDGLLRDEKGLDSGACYKSEFTFNAKSIERK